VVRRPIRCKTNDPVPVANKLVLFWLCLSLLFLRKEEDKIDLGSMVDESSHHVIPRKEVIQPHLPVRLPCYDFTPITDPTLDACLLFLRKG
jgi:hypothetical protein